MQTQEIRTTADQIRAEISPNQTKLYGYAARFNDPAIIKDRSGKSFREVIKPNAFRSALDSQKNIQAFWNHNADMVLGNTRSGSLLLSEDKNGLKFELSLPNTTVAKDAAELVRSGIVQGCSFGWNQQEDTWVRGQKGDMPLRELRSVDVIEISLTAMPVYPSTSVDVRSVSFPASVKMMEMRLRLADFD